MKQNYYNLLAYSNLYLYNFVLWIMGMLKKASRNISKDKII